VNRVLQSFESDWVLKWVKGPIGSYVLGKTPLELIEGRIRGVIESYDVSPKKVSTIINLVLLDYLLNIPREVRAKPCRVYRGN